MKTHHDSSRNRTITGDQALEIAMRISEARALMYLLGTSIQKEPHGITDEPDEEEQDGIGGLIRFVGQGLSDAFKSATNGSAAENALRGDFRGGSPSAPLSRTTPEIGGLHGDARHSRAIEGDSAVGGEA